MAYKHSELLIGDIAEFQDHSKRGPILVPMNNSDRARLAASNAIDIASLFRMPLRLETFLTSDASQEDAKAALRFLRENVGLQKTKPQAAVAIGVRCIADYWDDDEQGVARSIIEAAAETNAALIVLGVHSRRKLFFRTMTQKLILDVATPVLITTTRRERPWRRAVVAVDFSETSERIAEFAALWAPDAEFHLVHAVDADLEGKTSDADIQDRMAKCRSALAMAAKGRVPRDDEGRDNPELTVSHHIVTGPTAESLRRKVQELKADLLVLGTGGRTEGGKTALGGVASALTDQPPCDLLVISGRCEPQR
ncbi:universal stress protein [Hyphococcus sp.]|jgi:nucleotide-binding universal stress UspA family protein|uniref:universal stress protein n=1 Tax=Hyphococcus sp. TaxID=2038636 RepID=UPI003D133855